MYQWAGLTPGLMGVFVTVAYKIDLIESFAKPDYSVKSNL
jgi:hypothetical protein